MSFILGLETSCDDTSLALLEGNTEDLLTPPKLLAHQSFSQELLLQEWGGVVPEIAARNHMLKILPLLKETLKEAGNFPLEKIDLIGITVRPGLLGPLLTGLNVAKTLSLVLKTPLYPVNHLYAHLEAIHLSKTITYPYLGILVSGGHSIFFLVKGTGHKEGEDFIPLGTTIDDAAGEAFDKGGRLMGLPYPCGKKIDELAAAGNPMAHVFPIGLKHKNTADLSYSGLKTAMRYFLDEHPEYKKMSWDDPLFCDLVASYQHAIVMALKIKFAKAQKLVKERGLCPDIKVESLPIVVGGGVAANSYLRKILNETYGKRLHFVETKFCTDNGAMIANFAYRNFKHQVPHPLSLSLDASSSFFNKHEIQQKQGAKA